MPLTVGAGLVTVKPLFSVPNWVSVLVTTTFHGPAAAPVRLKLQVICVGETTTTELALISVLPLFVSLTVAPGRNPVPARLVIFTVVPVTPVLGVMPLTVGAGLVTVNPLLSVPDWVSVLVTTTFHRPTGRTGQIEGTGDLRRRRQPPQSSH